MSQSHVDSMEDTLQQQGPDGIPLFERIAELTLKVIESRPQNALERFEELWQQTINPNQPVELEKTASGQSIPTNILEPFRQSALKKAAELMEREEPSEEQPPSDVQFPNALDEAFYFRKFGVGLGEEELVQIMQHMKTHFSKLPLRTCRFFGKIIGTQNNYYIVEGEPVGEIEEEEAEENAEETGKEGGEAEEDGGGEEEGEEEEGVEELQVEADPDEPADPTPAPPKAKEEIPKEERKENTPNQFIYWACNSPTDPWKRLPDVLPQHIRAARLVTRCLTGSLNATVSEGFPSFPFKERCLLRAQIARIAHATTIIPKMQVPAGDAAEEAEEEGGGDNAKTGPNAVIDVSTLTDPSAWVHSLPPILVQGRVEKYPPVEDAGEEEEGGGPVSAAVLKQREMAAQLVEIWEGEDDLKAGPWNGKPTKTLSEDKGLCDDSVGAFSIVGELLAERKKEKNAVMVKSNYWPGAITIAYGGKRAQTARIYIGNGRKYTGKPYTMPPPPTLPEEYEDLLEQDDPTVEDEEALLKTTQKGMGEMEGEEEATEGEEEA